MSKQADALFKVSQEISHADAPAYKKATSLVECGAKCIDQLLKMKHGAFTTIKLALDGEDVSDCIFTFRILTSAEEIAIEDEMAKTGYSSIDLRYYRLYTALTLSAASVPYPSMKEHAKDFNSEELTKADLLTIPTNYLLALGIQYKFFVQRNSPKLEHITQEQIDDCIKTIEECEDDVKKFALLNLWNLNATHEVIIDLVKKLTNFKRQTAAAFIG